MLVFPRHKTYTDSNVDFIGEIPSHWKVTRIANVFEEIHTVNKPEEELLSLDRYKGIIKQSETGRKTRASKDRSAYRLIEPEQLGYNILNAFMGSIGVSKYKGILSPAYAVAKTRKVQNTWYFHYLFRTELYKRQFNRFSYGIMLERNRLYYDRFKTINTIVPPRDEQDKIVAYLRVQDAHIARFIKIKRELISLLNEQKQTLIHQAVTKGINPNVKLKPSGVEWLGDIPEHWEVRPLKFVSDVNFSGVDKHTNEGDDAVFLCNYTDVYKNHKITSKLNFMKATATKQEISKFTVNYGDVIITKDSESADDIAVPAWVSEQLDNVICGYHLALLRPLNERLIGEFLFNSLSAPPIAQQFHMVATGVTRFGLSKHAVKNALIAVPPKSEQEIICKWLNREFEPINLILSRAQQELDLIKDFRERLITDAVTGQIDVRNWQPSPDDDFDDSDLSALTVDDELMEEEYEHEDN